MSIKDPVNPAKPEEKPSLSERLNDFLRANRVALFAVAALIVVGVVGLGVSSAINQSKLKSSTEALEKLESRFEEWAQAEEAARATLSAELLTEADALIARYGKLYAGLRAGFMKARLHFATNDYAAAEAAYAAVAAAGPKSHLAPVALANAAAMAEEKGDREKAIAYLREAEAKYPKAPGAARNTFNIGRLYEGMKDYKAAMSAYAALVAAGQDNDWTKLARSRIIHLRALGLAQ